MFEKYFSRRAKKAQDDTARYRELLAIAVVGKLADSEGDELLTLAERLGIAKERIDADAEIIRRYRGLMATAGAAGKLASDLKRATKAMDDYREETQKMLAPREERQAELFAAANRLEGEHGKAVQAGESARSLVRQHFELLGVPDPAIAERKRHLVWNAGKPGDIPSVTVGQLISTPSCRLPAGGEWVIVPGQSEQEFAALSQLADDLSAGRVRGQDVRFIADDPARYIAPDNVEVLKLADLLATVDPTSANVMGYVTHQRGVDPTAWRIVPLPGQSRREVDAIREKLSEARARNLKESCSPVDDQLARAGVSAGRMVARI